MEKPIQKIYIPTLEVGIDVVLSVVIATTDLFLNKEMKEIHRPFENILPVIFLETNEEIGFDYHIKEVLSKTDIEIKTSRIFYREGKEKYKDPSFLLLRMCRKLGIKIIFNNSNEMEKDKKFLKEYSPPLYDFYFE